MCHVSCRVSYRGVWKNGHDLCLFRVHVNQKKVALSCSCRELLPVIVSLQAKNLEPILLVKMCDTFVLPKPISCKRMHC